MPSGKKSTPSQLWNHLVKDAGLELNLKKKPGRDADLELEVLRQLDPAHGTPSAYPSVKALLKADQQAAAPTVTVERLLVAVLESQKGFAAMMGEILDTLAMAEATLGERNLTIDFSYDAVTDSHLKQTLEQFRVDEERTRRVCVSRFVSLSQEQRSEIYSILRTLDYPSLGDRDDRLPLTPQVDATPAPARFRAPLLTLETMVADFLQLCRVYGESRTANYSRIRPDGRWQDFSEEEKQAISRAAAATDYWDVEIVDSINFIKHRASIAPSEQTTLLATLTKAVALIPTRQQWVDETYKQLFDLLNLPTWKRRHELYSVWVGTRLLNVAKTHASQLTFHTHGKVLSFAFGGSALATYAYNGAQFAIKCEVRSDLVGTSTKRKRAIQPDFRVLREGGTATPNDATYLVVECKHYLQQNVNNFATAASDYARSCRYATVLVVNHGPVEEPKLLSAVEPEVQNRARFIGDATPGTPAQLQAFLQTALFSTPARAPSVPSPRPQASANAPSTGSLTAPLLSVEVEWDAALQDIDLALAFDPDGTSQSVEINYMNKGSMGAPHYAVLQRDVHTGPGKETIDIYQLTSRRYEVIVRNYSKKGYLPAAHLCGRILLGNHRILATPPVDNVTEWKMAVLMIDADGTITVES